jgi:hypothetical protein
MPCPSHRPWLDHSNYTWRSKASYPNSLGCVLMLSSHLCFSRLPDAKCRHLYRCTFAYTEQWKDEMHQCSARRYRTCPKPIPIITQIDLSVYGSTALFQFLDLFTQSVGLLGRGISPSQGRYLHTQDSTNTE